MITGNPDKLTGANAGGRRQSPMDIHSLTSEELRRIATGFRGEYTDAILPAVVRELASRFTATVERNNFVRLVMPDLCGSCGAQPVKGSTTVSASNIGEVISDTIYFKIPLCARCMKPFELVEEANDNTLTTSLGCATGILGVAALVALFLAAFRRDTSGVWIAVFGIPAIIGMLVLKAMEYATVHALPSDQRLIYNQAKKSVRMLRAGAQVNILFENEAFAAQFKQLNALNAHLLGHVR